MRKCAHTLWDIRSDSYALGVTKFRTITGIEWFWIWWVLNRLQTSEIAFCVNSFHFTAGVSIFLALFWFRSNCTRPCSLPTYMHQDTVLNEEATADRLCYFDHCSIASSSFHMSSSKTLEGLKSRDRLRTVHIHAAPSNCVSYIGSNGCRHDISLSWRLSHVNESAFLCSQPAHRMPAFPSHYSSLQAS